MIPSSDIYYFAHKDHLSDTTLWVGAEADSEADAAAVVSEAEIGIRVDDGSWTVVFVQLARLCQCQQVRSS